MQRAFASSKGATGTCDSAAFSESEICRSETLATSGSSLPWSGKVQPKKEWTFPGAKIFCALLQVKGSVITRSLLFALPCALLAVWLKWADSENELPEEIDDPQMLINSAAYTGFNFAMGFVFVFRTQQAYNRYWEGITAAHHMYVEWMDCVSSVFAFGRYSQAQPQVSEAFYHRLVRLASLLHASSCATLRGIDGSLFELIDINGLEDEIVDRALLSPHPVSLVGQWILELVMEGIEERILMAPSPIISRCFQEFANGMVAYHDAMKIQTTDFPFPYQQMSAVMLLAHWCVTPWVMCQWVRWPSWVFLLTLLQVMTFWALYFTAEEIEFPFKKGQLMENDDAVRLHEEFNDQLLTLLSPNNRHIPRLSAEVELDVDRLKASMVVEKQKASHHRKSQPARQNTLSRLRNSLATPKASEIGPSYSDRIAVAQKRQTIRTTRIASDDAQRRTLANANKMGGFSEVEEGDNGAVARTTSLTSQDRGWVQNDPQDMQKGSQDRGWVALSEGSHYRSSAEGSLLPGAIGPSRGREERSSNSSQGGTSVDPTASVSSCGSTSSVDERLACASMTASAKSGVSEAGGDLSWRNHSTDRSIYEVNEVGNTPEEMDVLPAQPDRTPTSAPSQEVLLALVPNGACRNVGFAE